MKNALLLVASLLIAGCHNMPVREPINLDVKGTTVRVKADNFYYPPYYIGFGLRPPFLKEDRWYYTKHSQSETEQVYRDVNPVVQVIVRDSSGAVALKEMSRVSPEAEWHVTNSSPSDLWPGSVYKFVKFQPKKLESYLVEVHVIEPGTGAAEYKPEFFIASLSKFP